ncbi:MAG: DUF1631 family protein [Pseudomonadales bacterium]|nr:DUF1631 family protein [Pseudomonadales bacterium]
MASSSSSIGTPTGKSPLPRDIQKIIVACETEILRIFKHLLQTIESDLRQQVEAAQEFQDKNRIYSYIDSFTLQQTGLYQRFEKQWLQGKNLFPQHQQTATSSGELSLLDDEDLQEKIAVQQLIANITPELLFVSIPILSGFQQALPEYQLKPLDIPFFPEALGAYLQSTLKEASFDPVLIQFIHHRMRKDFFKNIKGLYLSIKTQLEKFGFQLQEADLNNLDMDSYSQGRQQPKTDKKLIEVDADFNHEILDLLKDDQLARKLQQFSQSPVLSTQTPLSAIPDNLAADTSIVTISNKDVDSMLANLSQLKTQDHQQIHTALANELKSGSTQNQYQVMSSLGENIINLVALLFECIQDNHHIHAQASSALMRLQIPFMRLALMDNTLFKNNDHSAKLLLNDLAVLAATDVNSGDFKLLLNCVDTLSISAQVNPELFAEQYEKTQCHLSQKEDISNERLQIIQSAEKNQASEEEQQADAQNAVENFVIDRIENLKHPLIFHALFEKVWSRVIYSTYVKYHGLSDERTESVDLFEKILWSTGAGDNPVNKRDLLRILPAIVTGIRDKLSESQMDDLIESHFLDQLREIHLRVIKTADGTAIKIQDADLQSSQKAAELVRQLHEERLQEKLLQQQVELDVLEALKSQAVGHHFDQNISTTDTDDSIQLAEPEASFPRANTEEISAELNFTATAKKIQTEQKNTAEAIVTIDKPTRLDIRKTLDILHSIGTGMWMDYQIKGEFQRIKVAFHSASLEKYIFVDDNGFKIFERSRADLMVDIQDGYAYKVDQEETFDHALQEVVTGLRNQRPALHIN